MFDNGDKSVQENVYDYDNYNVYELQVSLLDILQTEIESYIFPNGILEMNYDKAIKRNPDMEKLRLEVRKQQGDISSHINPEDFLNK